MATLKLVFAVAIFGLVILVGIKVIPPYFSNYEFQDAIKTEALQSTYSSRSEEDIRTAIIKQAHSYDIELTAKQVHVARSGTGSAPARSPLNATTAFRSNCPVTRPTWSSMCRRRTEGYIRNRS